MFEYVKMEIIAQSENPLWLFRNFARSGKKLDGRVVKFKDGTLGNHQIKHPNYANWFDVPASIVKISKPAPPTGAQTEIQ